MAQEAATALPTGTVTFLFTDVEGSTRRASALGDETWSELLATYRRLLREAFARGGHEVDTEGDGLFVAFARAPEAVRAAIDAQRAVQGHDWPQGQALRVRMGVHSGEAVLREGGYVGYQVAQASRICEAAHGGQILLSEATAGLVRDRLPEEATLIDLGQHRLKDLGAPQRLFSLAAPDLAHDFPPPRSLSVIPNNLPVQRSSFVGREDEIARVRQLLEAHSLVTLTGVGGAGKTRLALQLAAEALERYPDRVFFVDLALLAEPELVAGTTAAAAGLRLEGRRSAIEQLVDALVRRRTLLVLDNCEHLLDACADVADRILASCADVHLLATSREPLGTEGEQIYRVPSLSTPDEGQTGRSSEAVELFVGRARNADPHFELTAANTPAVAQICRRLDGIPLAIEFAAARVAHLTPQAIAERLDDRFRLLTGGRRRVRRQQTLEAALEWSHELLDAPQQTLLRRLAVFAGSFSLPMAEAICAGDRVARSDVLDLLAALVNKSLVATEAGDDEPRYRLLETVRTYAEGKLAAAGEAEAYRSRHRDVYLAWLESMSWEPLVLDAETSLAVTREHDNLRAALGWSWTQSRRDLVGRMAARMGVLWHPVGGHGEEGKRWLEWALEAPEGLDRAEQVACFTALAAASLTLGDPEQERYAARAIEIGRGAVGGPPLVVAYGIKAVAAATRSNATGDAEVAREARSVAKEGVRQAESLGARWLAWALVSRGNTFLVLADIEAAAGDFAAAGQQLPNVAVGALQLSTCRMLLGDPHGALDAARNGLAEMAASPAMWTPPQVHLAVALPQTCVGAPTDAASDLEAAIRFTELAVRDGVFLAANDCLIYAGAIAYETGNAQRASRLLSAAVAVGDARETPTPFRSTMGYAVYRHYRRLVREALGPDEARRGRDEGRAMSLDGAIAEAREVAEALRAVASTSSASTATRRDT